MEAIRLEKVTKYYGRSRGVIEIDLSVKKGEFFGFIGPNGAGKSTTIRSLVGLIGIDSGRGEIFGKEIGKGKPEILENIGYLPSETLFYPGMKVKDVIKLSAALHRKDCRAEANLLCERLMLDTAKKVEELSFGNRKKLGIVCALQHNPRLCILDEPTSGLDPLMQKEFFSILREKNEKGTTIFLSSHILSEIKNNCSRSAIIREGRIIACDSIENLSQTNTKHVTVKGSVDLSKLQGVYDLQYNGDMMNFLFDGDIGELIALLSKTEISDLTISEPELETIFMNYYLDGGEK